MGRGHAAPGKGGRHAKRRPRLGVREQRGAKTPRGMKRELLPRRANALPLRVVLRVLGELLQALRDRGDALARIEVVAFERVVLHHLTYRSTMTAAPPAPRDPKKPRRSTFFYVRVSILLLILFVVVLYAVRDVWSRRARNEWTRTLDVAVVLVHVESSDAIDPEAVQGLKERAAVLEARLTAETARLRWSHPDVKAPFRLRVFGPIEVHAPPPTPASDSPVDLAKQTVNMKTWLAGVDPSAGVIPEHWDTRIYVSIQRPRSQDRSFVEGASEQDGRVGAVAVELAPDMVDLTLFVVAHELMHTLGATDKYDASGRAVVPAGLVEPNRQPLYPQAFAEVMARNRPVSSSAEAVPQTLEELGVGEVTAREIGWLR